MKAPAPSFAIAAPLSILTALWVSVDSWEGLRPALLPALSVVAAAVFVRLARGFPFTNADHFSLPELRSTAKKLKDIARKLRMLIILAIASMVSLILFPALLDKIRSLTLPGYFGGTMDSTMSGITAFATAYTFLRILEVVQLDIALLKLQANILERAIAFKNGKNFTKEQQAHPPGPIAGETTFGRPLQ